MFWAGYLGTIAENEERLEPSQDRTRTLDEPTPGVR